VTGADENEIFGYWKDYGDYKYSDFEDAKKWCDYFISPVEDKDVYPNE